MQLIVLAAGMGKRLPLTKRYIPKCLTLINKKSIVSHNLNFYNKFKNKIIITGYRSNELENFSKKNKFKTIKNKKYKKTNMVYSLFLASRYIKEDVVVCYGDIIFNKDIYKNLKKKINIIPLNSNWLKLWKKRMTIKKIYKDAESCEVKNNYLVEIGKKIKNKFPTYQYMGIFKLKKKNFSKLRDFFKVLKSNKIDMTSFINLAIKKKIIKFKIYRYKSYWYEIDTGKDINITSKLINKW